IVANINKHILLDIGKNIVRNLTDHGKVILSGLLITDKDDIQNLYKEYNLQTIEEETMGEWLSLVLAKKD
ncbi:MAG: 50S ribosomal protein L11 methyltransferase, partial [Melioribacteraceae bacterium]|nr:50S ribosomal protein L11 methyltransferase [Melioribacteraceae bacterium]